MLPIGRLRAHILNIGNKKHIFVVYQIPKLQSMEILKLAVKSMEIRFSRLSHCLTNMTRYSKRKKAKLLLRLVELFFPISSCRV